MTGQQLKNSILQMAVQGKLVPQDPNDEPASVLLERIRAEKEKLIKEGKIKKEKNPSVIFRGADNLPYEKIGKNEPVCIADEVPFEIPESWEWVRFSSISSLVTKGTTPRGGNVSYVDSGIGFLRAENIAGLDKLDISRLNYIDEATHTGYLKRSIIQENDILITIAGTLGRTAIVKKENLPLNANQAVAIVRPVDAALINLQYLVYALNSPSIQEKLTAQKKITAIPNLTLEIVSNCLIPIPPIEEQQRIINCFMLILPHITKYAAQEIALENLNNDFPNQLKKSILQYAVQGNLVPQDPTDEPASVLLERIQAEKEQLIKSGKIKRDKHESVIFRRDNSYYERVDGIERCIDDEIPFEIPDSWEWVRLGNIGEWGSGATPSRTKSEYYNGTIPWLKTGDLNDGYITYIPETITNLALTETSVRLNPIGSVLIAMYGATIGKLGILQIPATTNQACCACVPFIGVYNKFLFYFLMSQKTAFIKLGEGGAQPNISKEKIVATLMPLPPNSEQYRIVEKIDDILSKIHTMR